MTGAAPVILRDVVRVSGPDASSFLQGQLSQDVSALADGESAWSLVLQPQGKVDAFVRVTREAPDVFVLDVDDGFGDAVVARLDRFKLRVKATIELAGPRPCRVDADADPATPLAAIGPVRDGPGDAPAIAPADWDALRVRLGIPAMGRELTADTIPEEAGVVDVSVSFTKGCYTGQELVARIDSRGRNVPRRLRRVTADAGSDDLRAGAALTLPDGKVVGAVTTAAGDQALAYVSRTVDDGAQVDVAGSPGMARIEALPPLR
ncbi:MAG TPA: hypothetical protein VF230_01395 [Acidimicrobiales bacterium]